MQKSAFKSDESERIRRLTFGNGTSQFIKWDGVVVYFDCLTHVFPSAYEKKVDLTRLTSNLVQSICCNISIERSCHVEFEYLHILSVVNMTKTSNEKV